MRLATRAAAAAAVSAVLVGMSALTASAADFAGSATATDTNSSNLYEHVTHPPLPGGGGALWGGGSLIFPAEQDGSSGDGNQAYPSVGAMLEAPRPLCADGSLADDGTVTVTVSVQVRNDGPSQGRAYVGGLRLYANGDDVVNQDITFSAPVGHQETLTVSAQVPAEALESGDIGVHLSTETYHQPSGTTYNSGTQWTADQFSATYEYGVGEDCADDIPAVAPAVALGAGVLALGGYGLFRRRQESQTA
ncbi:hypothetical protein [Phytoactinopolyspora limicola]|uniref:hypothetical protein n=1 Tax=Phytoactinopolyspora limicola TaxID=2715536 RepID=UPI00140CC774|nr:hypothetical protein [Phytoactinopolyspora limicola]